MDDHDAEPEVTVGRHRVSPPAFSFLSHAPPLLPHGASRLLLHGVSHGQDRGKCYPTGVDRERTRVVRAASIGAAGSVRNSSTKFLTVPRLPSVGQTAHGHIR